MWSQSAAVVPAGVELPAGGAGAASRVSPAPQKTAAPGAAANRSAASAGASAGDSLGGTPSPTEHATAAGVRVASAELAALTATQLHHFWGTFHWREGGGTHEALEQEFLAFRWRATCPTICKLAIAFVIFWLFTILLSVQGSGNGPGPGPGWVALVSLGVSFNAAFAAITARRWGSWPRSCWAAFGFANATMCVAGTMYSRTLSLESGTFASLHRPRAHTECGADELDPFIRWQVAHAAFFINTVIVCLMVFSRMPFGQGLCIAAMGTAGLFVAVDHAHSGLGPTCWGFAMGYLFPAAMVSLCTLFVLRTGEIEHRLAYVQRKINVHNNVLVRDSQRQLMRATKAAAQADASKRAHSRFVATFSHELRTPLTAIIGNLENLEQFEHHCSHGPGDRGSGGAGASAGSDATVTGDAAREARGKYVGRALSSSHLLLSLVNNILDLSRLEAKAFLLDRRDFSVPDMMQKVRDVVQTVAEARQLRVSFGVDPAVPSVVHGDRTRFQQILLNFAANACKFTPPLGRVDIDVHVVASAVAVPAAAAAEQPPDTAASACGGAGARSVTLRATVRDSGIGLPPSALEHIWDMFYQHQPSSGEVDKSGAGCGLAICKQLARLMGGDVSVKSELGIGSTFAATATFEEAQNTAPPAQPGPGGLLECAGKTGETGQTGTCAGGEARPGQERGRVHRVLLAEDNAFNAEVISDMLCSTCEVAHAANGAEAVKAYIDAASRGEGFALVLMDCNMPQMDGFAATRAIREWEHESGKHTQSPAGAGGVPVIALTAHSGGDLSIRQQCDAAGMGAFISKPVQRNDLIQCVQRILDTRQGTAGGDI